MIKLRGTNISITRGDTGYFSFTLKDKAGEEISLSDVSEVRCQVRKCVDGELLFEGAITLDYESNTAIWHIQPSDTNDLTPARYYYDAQVTFPNGDIYTFIKLSDFEVLPDITR